MDRIEIILAVITLLGGYFGLPKLIEAGIRKYQNNRIKSKAGKLASKISLDREKKSMRDEPLFDELKQLLWKAKESIKNKDFLQNQLNITIRNLYDSTMYDDIQELRESFEEYFEFSDESWANIAIANMNLYHWDGMKEYRDYALSAAWKSISKRPNYGDPKAVILLVNMIDHSRGREINTEELREFLSEILSGEDLMVSRTTYNYLELIRQIPAWEKYFNHLFELFPDEMEKMKQRFENSDK